jgi:hypothetical protein
MKHRHDIALALVGWYHRCSVGILPIHETPLCTRRRNTKMGVDLRMEPYATMCQNERPESRIFDELCLPDIDELFASLGLSLDEFHALADKDGRLPHEAALRLFKKGQMGGTLAHYYSQWYEHPELVAIQMQGISKGRAPRMEGEIGHLPDKRPYLVLR